MESEKDFYRLLRSYRPYVATLRGYQLKLVTLTWKNTAYLEGTVDRLRKAWKKLLRREPYRTLWHGGAYAIECVNKGKGWHVHLHALVEGGYIAQEQLVQDWLALTSDSFIVHLEACHEAEGGLRYILKYLLKAPTVEERREEYNVVLKEKRLIQAWGSWYGQQTPADKDEEIPHLVCEACGQSAWLVIIRPLDKPLADIRAYRELMHFFNVEVRAG